MIVAVIAAIGAVITAAAISAAVRCYSNQKGNRQQLGAQFVCSSARVRYV